MRYPDQARGSVSRITQRALCSMIDAHLLASTRNIFKDKVKQKMFTHHFEAALPPFDFITCEETIKLGGKLPFKKVKYSALDSKKGWNLKDNKTISKIE